MTEEIDLDALEQLNRDCLGAAYGDPDDSDPCRDYAFEAMATLPALIQRLREAEAVATESLERSRRWSERCAQLEQVGEAAQALADALVASESKSVARIVGESV